MAATDDFERATIGGNYSNGQGTYDVMEITGSSDLKTSTTVSACMAKRDAEAYANDHYVQGTLSVFVDTTNAWAQVAVRMDPTTAECYVASANAKGNSTVDVLLEHNDGAGAFTAIGSTVNVASAPGAGDVLRLECEGTTLRVYFKGTLRKTETDATLSTGKPGIGGFTAVTETDVQWESGEFGDLTTTPTISSIDDTTIFNGQNNVTITGTNFGASQGVGFVKISPTDNINDANAVEQTVTSWADTSINFTAVRGTLDHTDTLYCFVEQNLGDSNASGSTLSFVDETPGYLTAPSVTLQDSTSYNITAETDFDATMYAVAVKKDETAPTIAQVKAGNGTGDVAAQASANKAMLGDTEPSDLVLSGLTFPIYDLYVVSSNTDGDSALTTLVDEALDAPTGKQHVTIALKEITAASKADPCRITVTGHGFTTAQQCRIWGVGGMTELNDGGDKSLSPDDGLLYYDVTVVDANTLDLDDIDSTGYTTYTSGGVIAPGISVLENSSLADGDIERIDLLTSSDGYTVTANVDGTFSYAAASDQSRQTIVVDAYDVSLGAMCGEATFTINNVAPALIGSAIPGQLWIVDEAITPIVLSTYIDDFEGDVIVWDVANLPDGVTHNAGTISGTPTAESGDVAVVTATDSVGDATNINIVYAVQIPQDEDGEVSTTLSKAQFSVTVLPEKSSFDIRKERTEFNW